MEFDEVVRRRRMVRQYDPERPVAPEVRERILANGLRAPSAGFAQGWAFLTLEGDDRERFWRIGGETGDVQYAKVLNGLRAAPLLILAFAHKDAYLDRYAQPDKGWADRAETHWTAPYWYVDTGMAILLMLQTVVDEGLGACFFGPRVEVLTRLLEEFGVPAGYELLGVLAIGHRAPDRQAPSLADGRRTTAEVVHRGQWGRRPR
jgi:nitroreductase